MPLHDLLNTLQQVKKTGASRYIAACPAHQDKRPSLTITEKDDGVVLIKCWAGCGAAEILSAVGLDYAALYPTRTDDHRGRAIKRPWNPYDILKLLEFESTIAYLCAKKLAEGKPLSEREQTRLLQTVSRLSHASECARG